MIGFETDNVNTALPEGIHLLKQQGVSVSPRGIPTKEMPEPVVTIIKKPWQRALLDPVRDANPFFHLIESLWILAGKNDVRTISYFNENVTQFSDDGVTFHGAYGYRLRHHFLNYTHLRGEPEMEGDVFDLDQFEQVIRLLKKDPDSRQAVLQIYDPTTDLNVDTKDVPCNTQCYLKIRDEKLNITVMCRSSDIIWGLYGTDLLQFSFIQEYFARMLNVNIGSYRHISDSYHMYTDREQTTNIIDRYNTSTYSDPYREYDLTVMGLCSKPEIFMDELLVLMSLIRERKFQNLFDEHFENDFLRLIVVPMVRLYKFHKDWLAANCPKSVMPPENFFRAREIEDLNDWAIASVSWIQRRRERKWGMS